MDVEGHLATALSQDSVLDLLKKGSAVEREGGGRGLGDHPFVCFNKKGSMLPIF